MAPRSFVTGSLMAGPAQPVDPHAEAVDARLVELQAHYDKTRACQADIDRKSATLDGVHETIGSLVDTCRHHPELDLGELREPAPRGAPDFPSAVPEPLPPVEADTHPRVQSVVARNAELHRALRADEAKVRSHARAVETTLEGLAKRVATRIKTDARPVGWESTCQVDASMAAYTRSVVLHTVSGAIAATRRVLGRPVPRRSGALTDAQRQEERERQEKKEKRDNDMAVLRALSERVKDAYKITARSKLAATKIYIGCERVWTDIEQRFPGLAASPGFTVADLLVSRSRNELYCTFTRLVALDFMCSRRMNGKCVTYSKDYTRLTKEYRNNIFEFADAVVHKDPDEGKYALSRTQSYRKRKRKIRGDKCIDDNASAGILSGDDNAYSIAFAHEQEEEKRRQARANELKDRAEATLSSIINDVTKFDSHEKQNPFWDVGTSIQELREMAEIMLEGIDETQQRTITNFKGVAQRVGEMSGIKEEDLFSTPREAWERLWGVSEGLHVIAERLVDAAGSNEASTGGAASES